MNEPTIKKLRDWLNEVTESGGLPVAKDDDRLFLQHGETGPCVAGKPQFAADFNWCGHKRTFILLYPDDSTDSFGQDVYVAWTTEPEFKDALAAARLQAAMAQHENKVPDDNEEGEPDWQILPQDFALVLAYPGHIAPTHGQFDDED